MEWKCQTPNASLKSLATSASSASSSTLITVSQVMGVRPLPSSHSINIVRHASRDWWGLSFSIRSMSWPSKCSLVATVSHFAATLLITLTVLPLPLMWSSSYSRGSLVRLRFSEPAIHKIWGTWSYVSDIYSYSVFSNQCNSQDKHDLATPGNQLTCLHLNKSWLPMVRNRDIRIPLLSHVTRCYPSSRGEVETRWKRGEMRWHLVCPTLTFSLVWGWRPCMWVDDSNWNTLKWLSLVHLTNLLKLLSQLGFGRYHYVEVELVGSGGNLGHLHSLVESCDLLIPLVQEGWGPGNCSSVAYPLWPQVWGEDEQQVWSEDQSQVDVKMLE